MPFMRRLKQIRTPMTQETSRRPSPSTFFQAESSEPLHGFVIVNHHDSLKNQLQGSAIAESFSDHVVQVSKGIFYGSLTNTISWFGSTGALCEHLGRLLHPSASEATEESVPDTGETEKPIVVVGSNFIRTFFYAMHLTDGNLHIANKDNLGYRRFCRQITWEQWLLFANSFVALLDLTSSRLEKCQKELATFCKQMRTMRFRKPFDVPESLDEPELARRFGLFAAQLWHQWHTATDNHLPLKQLPLPFDPQSYETSSHEFTPEGSLFTIDRTATIAMETFFACLEKVQKCSTLTHRAALRDFKLRVVCSANVAIESVHSLVEPIFERSKKTEAMVQLILERQGNSLLEGALVPTWMERVTVVPVSLHFEQNPPTLLFESHEFANRTLDDIGFELALLDKSNVNLYALANSIIPETSVITKASFNATCSIPPCSSPTSCLCSPHLSSPSSPPHSSNETGLSPLAIEHVPDLSEQVSESDLYCHAHTERPCMLLREPLPLSAFERSKSGLWTFRFSESLDDFDYFVASTQHCGAQLWTRSPTTDRTTPTPQRNQTVVGIFIIDS